MGDFISGSFINTSSTQQATIVGIAPINVSSNIISLNPIYDANIATHAGIEVNKLAPMTPNLSVITDSLGFITTGSGPSGYIPTSGGAITGDITQITWTSNTNGLTTKGYVDSAPYVHTSGGAITGDITQTTWTSNTNGLTTKGYVDSAYSADGITILETSKVFSNIMPPAYTQAAADILAGDNSIPLTSSNGFTLTNGFIACENEIIQYSNINTLIASNLTRGALGTTAANHIAGTYIYYLSSYVPITSWTSFVPTFGTTGLLAPTLGNSTYTAYYRRIGQDLFINVDITIGTTATTGSGYYLFNMPGGYLINTSVATITTALASNMGAVKYKCGTCTLNYSSSSVAAMYAYNISNSQFTFWGPATNAVPTFQWGSGFYSIGLGVGLVISLRIEVPIVNWF